MIRSLLPLLLTGCVGLGHVTETGNPELDVSMALTGTSTDARVTVADLPAVTVTEAYVVVDDVRLVEADGCETAAEVEHTAEGPFAVDLLADAPFRVDIPAPATDYCRLRVRLDRSDGEPGLPAAMDDHAVFLAGTRGDDTPFELRSREKFELDLRSRAAGFALEEGHASVILAFDLGAWLAPLDLADARVDDDGVIYVDEDANSDLLDAFEDAVDAALSLHADDDDDGRVGDDDAVLAD